MDQTICKALRCLRSWETEAKGKCNERAVFLQECVIKCTAKHAFQFLNSYQINSFENASITKNMSIHLCQNVCFFVSLVITQNICSNKVGVLAQNVFLFVLRMYAWKQTYHLVASLPVVRAKAFLHKRNVLCLLQDLLENASICASFNTKRKRRCR